MFVPVTEKERQAFIYQNNGCFIPGYTGHCPTLRFHYGKCYGARTKEILRGLRDKGFLQEVREQYRETDPGKVVLKPILKSKDQFRDFALDSRYRAPKYIIGYTGFVPTLNFRYGKSYGRAADDSMYEFSAKQGRVRAASDDVQKYSLRSMSAPKMASIRSKDEIMQGLKTYEDGVKYQDRIISPEYPPIAGYTGHIPRVKGNEESLSQRYNNVVKRGLTLLKEEKDRRDELKKAKTRITSILKDAEGKYSYKEV